VRFDLAVTLYALTRDEDRDLALVAFACRVGEGLASALVMRTMVEQLCLGTTGRVSLDGAATQALGTLLFTGTRAWNASVAATFFTDLLWLPLAAFEIPLGAWWLIKGDTTRTVVAAAPIAITPKES